MVAGSATRQSSKMKILPWIISALLAVACAGAAYFGLHERDKKNELAARFVKLAEVEKQMEAKMKEMEAASALKPLPLKVSIRPGALVLENKGDQNLTLEIIIKRALENPTVLSNVVINASAQKAIGETEGWSFLSGDMVEIKSDGFRPGHIKYP